MKAILYSRCSTSSQENSLEIQNRLSLRFCASHGYEVVSSYSEVASGKQDDRPMFQRAVSECLAHNYVLVATKIDRLARRISTIGKLIDSGVQLRVVSVGDQPVSKMVLAVFSAMAECERDFISLRTKEALSHLKSKGVKLGNPNIAAARVAALRVRQANAATYREDMLPVIAEIQSSGISTLQGIADSLNRRGYSARRGGCFYPGTVRSILKTQRV